MADDKQQAGYSQHHFTADEINFEPWITPPNYWTLKINDLPVGYVSDSHYKLYPLTSRFDLADVAVLIKVVQDHLNMIKITKRLLHGKTNL